MQIFAVGQKPTQKRPIIGLAADLGRLAKNYGTSAVVGGVLGVVIASAGLSHVRNTTSFLDTNERFSTESAKAYGVVIGKMKYMHGLELEEKNAPKDGSAVITWQPEKDAPNSAYQLLVSIPGELKTAVIAVSKNTYDEFCQKPNMTLRQSDRDERSYGDFCGRVIGGLPNESVGDLDTVEVSFTKNKATGDVQITEFAEAQKSTTRLSDIVRLRRASENRVESMTIHPKDKRIPANG